MPKKKNHPVTKTDQSGSEPEPKLPPGVTLLHTLEGHSNIVQSVAFDPAGGVLASTSSDGEIKLWEVPSGKLLTTLVGHTGSVYCVAFNPKGQTLASGGMDRTVKVWDAATGDLIRTIEGHGDYVVRLAFDPEGLKLAGAGNGTTIEIWDPASGDLLRKLAGHEIAFFGLTFDPTGQMLLSGGYRGLIKLWDAADGSIQKTLEGHGNYVATLAFDPTGQMLASGSDDHTVKLWEMPSGKLLRTLEGHTKGIDMVAFSGDGRLLASKSTDDTIRLWNCKTWETVAILPEPAILMNFTGLAFHPTLPLLATSGSKAGAPKEELCREVHLWELDFDLLLNPASERGEATGAVHHTTAKIVLVGDSGVGKTGLGWRLAHKEFKEHSSTHGQQFWILDQLSRRREDGTECEAILWDLAGQPDYRLTHALFLDDADLALLLFDPTDSRDPLHGVEFWLKQLQVGGPESGEAKAGCSTILVGARADRGEARLTHEELEAFCQQRGIAAGYLPTSAKENIGLDELLLRMQSEIAWDEKPATVTTFTFKRIKDYVLGLKENPDQKEVMVSQHDLRARLEKTDPDWKFTDPEMMTAVGHLANYGYVRLLRTSKGEERILLAPELLNNLAASLVLEARRSPKGLGSLEESRILSGDYQFRDLESLSREERDDLLDAAVLLFLKHSICFRETDPLNEKSFLVFPELINLKKPVLEDEQETEDGVAYSISGAVENVYASLVVLLGYTQTFTRTAQWRSQARYEVGDGLICGFRQDEEHDGEMDLVLYFGTNVGQPVQTLFQGLFESFLARRNLNVFRFEPVVCSNAHALNRAVVREQLRIGNAVAFCPQCGEKCLLPKAHEPIQLTQMERGKVDEQRWFADRRSRFEQAVFRLTSYVEGQGLSRPECFISYAWGDKEQERWVERTLATDLQKAGITVVLDRWENDRAGKSVSRFVSRIADCPLVIPIGTPRYLEKFKNRVSSAGSVVASEVDLISQRLMGTEAEKETVLPVLLVGERKTALPPLMWDRVYRDFRDDRAYFITAFDLTLDLYGIAHNDPAVGDLRDSLA